MCVIQTFQRMIVITLYQYMCRLAIFVRDGQFWHFFQNGDAVLALLLERLGHVNPSQPEPLLLQLRIQPLHFLLQLTNLLRQFFLCLSHCQFLNLQPIPKCQNG